MRAGQKLVGSDGKEVMLFPLEYLYITQGENGSYSHQGILAIDFVEWSNNGQVPNATLYAPCSCKCVAILNGPDNGRIFQSLDKVHTPNGLKYVSFICFHDNNPIASVGDTFNQGDVFAHTGTAGNVTGDHVHFNTAYGPYAGWENVPPNNNGELVNSSHIYETCYVNDTIIVESNGYNWVTYSGGVTPSDLKNKKFPWVLYSRKLRNKHTFI